MQNYGDYFGKMWQKLPRRAKDMRIFLTISLRFEEFSLHWRNMDSCHQFCGIVGSIFSDMGTISGHKFEPKWHVLI